MNGYEPDLTNKLNKNEGHMEVWIKYKKKHLLNSVKFNKTN